jgi:hypothetical protein
MRLTFGEKVFLRNASEGVGGRGDQREKSGRDF